MKEIMSEPEEKRYTLSEVLDRLLLTDEELLLCEQHREYAERLDDMLDGDEKFGDFKDENPNAQSNTQRET